MMILDQIIAVKRQELERLAETFQLGTVEKKIASLPSTRGFRRTLEEAGGPVALIAEVKKASPSKGVIAAHFDPVHIASQYEAFGAACISVLTDVRFFQGSPKYLTNVSQTVKLPILRKDFIIDERQIYEARLIGADAILLIAAVLSERELRNFRRLAESLGLDALVEVHDERELDRALSSGATLIGVNNRDLHDFTVDLHTTARLADCIPPGTFLVSESGISSYADVEFVRSAGAKAILVGESLMRAQSIQHAIKTLLGGSPCQ
jgi:indole-3-glycerol phosphate synthase